MECTVGTFLDILEMEGLRMKFEEIETYAERNEIILIFSNWLKDYTNEVIIKVMAKRDKIISNDFAMKLLKELKKREDKEREDFDNNIARLFRDYDGFKEFDMHNHPTTHSVSYRDVLYDMYIK